MKPWHIQESGRIAWRYLIAFLVTAVVVSAPVAPIMLFLLNAGELTSYERAARVQQERPVIYGPSTNGNYFQYKLELIRVRKPEVVVLGSSRMLGYRQEDFIASFVNAGRVMENLDGGREFLEELFKFHKPKLILLGLDFLWFNEAVPNPPNLQRASQAEEIRLEKLIAPVRWLRDGKISVSTFATVVFKRDRRNASTNWDNLGVNGIESSTGFRPDGSYQYGSTYFTPGQHAMDVQRVSNGLTPFIYGQHIGDRMDGLQGIVRLTDLAGVKLVIVTPPLAPSLLAKMEELKERYGYIREMRNALTNLAVEHYDFLTGEGIVNDPCEYMIGGWHTGEVLDQRILLSIITRNPNSALAPYTDRNMLKNYIAVYQGRTLAIFDESLYNRKEVDFLGLGCPK